MGVGGSAGRTGSTGHGGSAPGTTGPSPAGGAPSRGGAANAGATSGAAGGAGSSTARGIPVCESPLFNPINQLVTCANGFVHRAQASLCGFQPATESGSTEGASAGAGGEVAITGAGYGEGCTQDSDCMSGTACVCDPEQYLPNPPLTPTGQGVCVLATCRTDADCGAGSYCAIGNLINSGEALPGFGCLRADDECTTDADCASLDELCLEQTRRTCSLPPL